MKESCREGIANHPDPESCVDGPQGRGEALDRGTGRPNIELRNQHFGAPTLFREGEGNTVGNDRGELPEGPAQSKPLSMSGNSMRENRETPAVPEAVRAGRLVKAMSYTTSAYAAGESHGSIVPAKGPNKGDKSLAEGLEGRLPAKESAGGPCTHRTLCRASVPHGSTRAREAACRLCQGVLFRRYSSKARAVCTKSACTDPCGGRRVTGVPTATKGSHPIRVHLCSSVVCFWV